MRNNSENKTNEIKELEPGMLFYGKSKKTNVIGYGLLLGPHETAKGYWSVRILTIDSYGSKWNTTDIPEKAIREEWPKLYEWVA
jgi:hypothetical protein